jgi:hypothetical protein
MSINIGTNPTGIRYKLGANFIDICNNFISKNVGSPNIFNGQNFSTGVFCYYNSVKYDLAELYTLNSTLNTNLTINSNIFTKYNTISYDINSFFIPPPQTNTMILTGASTVRGFTDASITTTSYNGTGATSGTLYSWRSTTTSQTNITLGTFRLTAGSLNCYLFAVGPGAGATTVCGGGGSGFFIAFSLSLNVTYTIEYSGTGIEGNTIAGYCTIRSNDSPQTINITTPGGRVGADTAAATQIGNITGGTAFVGGGRAIAEQSQNGGNGFVITSSVNTGSVSNTGHANFSTLIALQAGKNGFSASGKAARVTPTGQGGRGGVYDIGATAFVGMNRAGPGTGPGTAAGSRSPSGLGGANGSPGLVSLYLSPLI